MLHVIPTSKGGISEYSLQVWENANRSGDFTGFRSENSKYPDDLPSNKHTGKRETIHKSTSENYRNGWSQLSNLKVDLGGWGYFHGRRRYLVSHGVTVRLITQCSRMWMKCGQVFIISILRGQIKARGICGSFQRSFAFFVLVHSFFIIVSFCLDDSTTWSERLSNGTVKKLHSRPPLFLRNCSGAVSFVIFLIVWVLLFNVLREY